MILRGKERYRWLARKSAATRRPRHVFIESADFSLCARASRYGIHDEWAPDAERDDCRVCRDKIEDAVAAHPGLTELTW